MFLAIGASAVALLFGPVGSALGRRLAGRHDSDDLSAQVEETRAQMTAEVDDLRNRLVEVEERLDFAERLLANGGPAHQLPGGARQ